MSNAKYAAKPLTMTIAVAAVALTATVSTVSPAVKLSADSTALIMGGTSVPTPDDAYIDIVKSHYIAPTHPGQDIDYVPLTTPEEGRLLTGAIRLAGFALGPPSVWGPGGSGWPKEPWWKLSGLFDRTYDQSTEEGVVDLEKAMADHGNDHLVIYGYSQGAMIETREKRILAAQYPTRAGAPDIDFVLSGDPNLPNGGIFARFPDLHIPVIGLSFNGAEPTNSPFDTVVITRQYDGLADFPLSPLNVVADLNALLGVFYVHLNDLDASLSPDPSSSTLEKRTYGDTTYYFSPTQHLPLFGPLRTLGVPEPLIDIVEPVFRTIVELGYDRTISPGEPTPARLIPRIDPAKVIHDLVAAVGEGVNNGLTLIGSGASSTSSTMARAAAQPSADAAPKTANAGISKVSASGLAAQPNSKTTQRIPEISRHEPTKPHDKPAIRRLLGWLTHHLNVPRKARPTTANHTGHDE